MLVKVAALQAAVGHEGADQVREPCGLGRDAELLETRHGERDAAADVVAGAVAAVVAEEVDAQKHGQILWQTAAALAVRPVQVVVYHRLRLKPESGEFITPCNIRGLVGLNRAEIIKVAKPWEFPFSGYIMSDPCSIKSHGRAFG